MDYQSAGRVSVTALFAIVLFAASSPVSGADSIRISSEQWDGATERDGTGLYWDIIRAVYSPAGIDVERRSVPYARSIRETLVTDKADAWVASYMDEVEGALFPESHFDADYVSVVYDPEVYDGVDGEERLEGADVAWMRGYAYDEYLSVDVEATRVDDRVGGLHMVERGRVDFFIDAAVEVEGALEEGGFERRLESTNVLELPLYLGFADTQAGREFRRIWDERMPQLLEDGTISRLYQRHEWGVWPFAEAWR